MVAVATVETQTTSPEISQPVYPGIFFYRIEGASDVRLPRARRISIPRGSESLWIPDPSIFDDVIAQLEGSGAIVKRIKAEEEDGSLVFILSSQLALANLQPIHTLTSTPDSQINYPGNRIREVIEDMTPTTFEQVSPWFAVDIEDQNDRTYVFLDPRDVTA